MLKAETKTPQEKSSIAPRSAYTGRCPACGAEIVWQPTALITGQRYVVPCQPQRRIVIFDYESDKHGLPKNFDDTLVLFDEANGEVIIGRKSTPQESRLYKMTSNPGAPYAIGRENHYLKCERFDRWLKENLHKPSIKAVSM